MDEAALVAYIAENKYGNFVPFLSSVHPSPGDDDSALFPEAQGMTCINLEEARRFLESNIPDGATLLPNPVKQGDHGILWLSQLTASN